MIDGRGELIDEVLRARDDVRTYLRRELRTLLENDEFLNTLPGMLELGRDAIVIERMRAMAA